MQTRSISLADLRAHYPSMGWALFKDQNSLAATSRHYNVLIVVKNFSDGVGDYIHAKHFAREIKEFLQPYFYNIGFLLQTEHEDDKGETRNAEYIINDLQTHYTLFCDKYWVFRNSLDYQTESPEELNHWLQKSENKGLEDFISHSIGIIEVSAGLESPLKKYFSQKLIDFDIPLIESYQYGECQDATQADYPFFSSLPMGLPINNESAACGIEINHRISQLDPIDILLNLSNKEPLFVSQLLNTTIFNKENIEFYLKSHRFIPGYIQDKRIANIFIASYFLTYKDEGRCDFFLPHRVIEPNEIISFLKDMELIQQENEVQFLSNDSHLVNDNAVIRIFTHRIESDSDYDSLYGISSDGAACSGDNSTSLVFSSNNLPFLQYKDDDIISDFFYKGQLIGFIQRLLDDRPRGDMLIAGLKKLINYFNKTQTITSAFLKRPIKNEMVELIKTLSIYQGDAQVKEAWKYVSEKIRSNYDIFNQLRNAIKYLMFNTAKHQLKPLFLQTAEAQYLIQNSWITEKSILTMPIYFFKEFLNPNFIEHLPESRNPPINPMVYYAIFPNQVRDVLNHLHYLLTIGAIKNELLIDAEINILTYGGIIEWNESMLFQSVDELKNHLIKYWANNLNVFIERLNYFEDQIRKNEWPKMLKVLIAFFKNSLDNGNKSNAAYIHKIASSLVKISLGIERQAYRELADWAFAKSRSINVPIDPSHSRTSPQSSIKRLRKD